MIKLEIFCKDIIIESIEMDLCDYYDGDTYDNIVRSENIVAKGITSIKGTQYNSKDKPYQIWVVYFDDKGNMTKDEVLLDEDYE